MSNSVNTNPLVLDTASTSSVIIPSSFYITDIVWNSGTSGVAGDSLVLKDKNANVLVDVSIGASKDSRTLHFANPVAAAGLIAHTIAHGVAYVYWKSSRNG